MMIARIHSVLHSHRYLIVINFLSVFLCLCNHQHVSSSESINPVDSLPHDALHHTQDHSVSTDSQPVNITVHIPLKQLYCEYPKEGFYKARGSYQHRFALEKVFIVISSSIHSTEEKKGLPSSKHSCRYEDYIAEHHSSKITRYLEVIDMYKVVNKYKGGFKNVAMVPEERWCSSQSMSPNSLINSISLGEDLASIYQILLNGTDPKHTSKYIQVLSNQNEKYYQSTLAFLYGILPEKQFTHVQIQKSTNNFCSSLCDRSFSCRCKRIEYLETYMQNALQKGWHLLKDTFDHVSGDIKKLLSLKTNTAVSSSELLTYLVSNLCNGAKIGCNRANCSLENILNELNEISSNYFRSLVATQVVRSSSKLFSFPFLTMISKSSMNIQNDLRKLYIFSGDDFFLSNLLIALNITPVNDVFRPKSFVIEIYKHGSEYFFQALYNGRNVTANLTFCQNNIVNKLCKVDALVTFVLQTGGLLTTSYEEACKL